MKHGRDTAEEIALAVRVHVVHCKCGHDEVERPARKRILEST
jgi:hypothetical protein